MTAEIPWSAVIEKAARGGLATGRAVAQVIAEQTSERITRTPLRHPFMDGMLSRVLVLREARGIDRVARSDPEWAAAKVPIL